MKTLYYFQGLYGTYFVNEQAEYVNYIHDNDGDYRSEYMDFIPKYFGGQMIWLDIVIPEMNCTLHGEDTKELCHSLKLNIIEAIIPHIKNR